MSRITRRPVF